MSVPLAYARASVKTPTVTEATGWQQHSVQGFISGALKKDRGITIASQKDGAGNRRYKIVAGGG